MTQTSPSTERAHPRLGSSRAAWPTAASWLLCGLVAPVVAYGLLSGTAYRGYSHDLVLSSRAQDVLTALVLPVLVRSGVRASRGSLAAHVLWLGLMFYLAYSYAIYLIGWPQNRAFLLYAAVVTISVACLLDGVARIDVNCVQPAVARLSTRAIGWFLVVVGVLFTALWLSDVGPSVWGGRQPAHVGVGGAPYAVYILDLTVALPVLVATGVMLVRRHPMGAIVGGVVLVKVLTLFTALWLGVAAQALAGGHVRMTSDMVPSALLLVVTAAVLVHGRQVLATPAPRWLRTRLDRRSLGQLPQQPLPVTAPRTWTGRAARGSGRDVRPGRRAGPGARW